MAALKGQDLCFSHSPTTAEQRAVARGKGGKRNRVKGGTPVDIGSVAALQDHLAQTLGDLLVHENSIQKSLAIKAVILAAAKLIEEGETKKMLEEIRDELLAQQAQGRSRK
jgi:hypothetical protein